MRPEPHSYPWCNLHDVKTATVGKEHEVLKKKEKKDSKQKKKPFEIITFLSRRGLTAEAYRFLYIHTQRGALL